MAKRGYKLQEFVAHSGNVNCLNIGKKTCRHLITGGDDQKVNLWSIGRPTSLTSLSGHASPIESVAFDSAEILVVAGASAGVIKLWDLEETKMVRTLTGHRSNCTAVEFHPFGEFFASGSMDTNLKVWDIRKKGCIHSYKGHTQGISTIRFSPDGRWVVSGGLDNVVKVWDLTAGKLLHDFKFHGGHIQSIDFHPLEFLLATGSADRTVKFWDLETFELIGSSRAEAIGVRSITFHPDGRTLFCGFNDGLKIYSWEPVICHDVVDMGWSTLGDLCISDGKLLGCSYLRNSVGIWVADISVIEPYGIGLASGQKSHLEQKYDNGESTLLRVKSHRRSSSSLGFISPDYETDEIKNIYVDSGNPAATRKVETSDSSKVVMPPDCKKVGKVATQKHGVAAGLHSKSYVQAHRKSFIVPSVVPRDSNDGKDSISSRREPMTNVRPSSNVSLKPSHVRRQSDAKFDVDKLLMTVESGQLDNMKSALNTEIDANLNNILVTDGSAKEFPDERLSSVTTITEKFGKILSPQTPSNQENCAEVPDCSKEANAVKIVNGVKIMHGRTRSLVERFEKREKMNGDEVKSPDTAPNVIPQATTSSSVLNNDSQSAESDRAMKNNDNVAEELMQNHDIFLSTLRSRLTKLQVVQHLWVHNDIKGAVSALRKLPDHSVQADVISVLMEKMEILTLDLFSCLLPVLLGLLDSNMERHANISLEMLLKLVAVFGPIVRSAISAPPTVGIDLQAEQRLECCNQCFIQLQRIQSCLPVLIRKGGSLAKCAQELNLVLQAS